MRHFSRLDLSPHHTLLHSMSLFYVLLSYFATQVIRTIFGRYISPVANSVKIGGPPYISQHSPQKFHGWNRT